MAGERKPFRAGCAAGHRAAYQPQLMSAAAAGTATLLADCSEYQSDIDDAAYLAWSRAIVVRALYGADHVDAAWYGGARRAALHEGGALFVGLYQYLVADQSAGVSQATAFHQLVGPIQPGEVFIADFEEGSRAVLTAWYNEMLSLYGDGIGPYLWTYTGLDFGQAQGVLPVQWIADYTGTEPASPHKLWQFTSTFSVPGIPGTCDCSVFRGTIDELATLAYQPEGSGMEITTPPPGNWEGTVTVLGKGTDGNVWETKTPDGKTWTTPVKQ